MRAARGAGGLFVLVVIALAMVAVLALGVFLRVKTNVDDATQTLANMNAAAAALEQYVAGTGRLPCPADPTQDTGVEAPDTVSTCLFPTNKDGGTIPWKTIGLSHDAALDAWGWKISYRVYTGNPGSLVYPTTAGASTTSTGGASMVNCDTSPPAPVGVDVNGLCRTDHATTIAQFLAGKGLQVTDFGTVYSSGTNNGAAYVLISHGPTGLGAYTSNGTLKDQPKSQDEKNNAGTGPYSAEAASSPEDPPDSNTHFDDILLYRTISDLANRTHLVARPWSTLAGLASIKFDTPTLTPVLGAAPARGDLGRSTLNMSGATVASTSSSISFDVVGGVEGIGVSGGGNTAIQNGEGIRVDLQTPADKLAITLNNAGTFFGAQVQFFRNGSLVSTLAAVSCHSTAVSSLNSFTLTPSGQFDRFVVSNPVNNTFFLLSEFRTCTAAQSSCVTSLDAPANHCP